MVKVVAVNKNIYRAALFAHTETASHMTTAAAVKDRLNVLCGDGEWYAATVISVGKQGKVGVIYDADGYKETLTPGKHEFKPLVEDATDGKAKKVDKKVANNAKAAAAHQAKIDAEKVKLKTMTDAAHKARSALNRKRERARGNPNADFTAEEEQVKSLFAAQLQQFNLIKSMRVE